MHRELYGFGERDDRRAKYVSLSCDLTSPSPLTLNRFLTLFPPVKNLIPRMTLYQQIIHIYENIYSGIWTCVEIPSPIRNR